MKLKTIVILSVTVLLFGCATYPQTREEQATYHAKEAQKAISEGQIGTLAYQINLALARPTGDA